MKSIEITTDLNPENPVQLIFLYGRFIVHPTDPNKDDEIVNSYASIEELVLASNLRINGLYENFSNIKINIKDEDVETTIEYAKDDNGYLYKDNKLIESTEESYPLNELEVMFFDIVDILYGYKEKWAIPTNYHYSFTVLKIYIYDIKGDFFVLNLTNWPTDEEFNFIKADYILFHEENSGAIGTLDYFTKENLLDTIETSLDKLGYIGSLPTKIECVLFNEVIDDDGKINLEAESEVDKTFFKHGHNIRTVENVDEIRKELYPKCTKWIIEEVEYWKDWFDNETFNISNQLNEYQEYDSSYCEDEANTELQSIIDKHTEIALKDTDSDENIKRVVGLNDLLKDDGSMYNPKYDLTLEGKSFFMRSYIEDGKSWTWIKDGKNDSSTFLFFKDIRIDSSENDKRKYQALFDYMVGNSKMI